MNPRRWALIGAIVALVAAISIPLVFLAPDSEPDEVAVPANENVDNYEITEPRVLSNPEGWTPEEAKKISGAQPGTEYVFKFESPDGEVSTGRIIEDGSTDIVETIVFTRVDIEVGPDASEQEIEEIRKSTDASSLIITGIVMPPE